MFPLDLNAHTSISSSALSIHDPNIKLDGDKTPTDQAEDINSGQESCSLMIISNVLRALQLCAITDKRF